MADTEAVKTAQVTLAAADTADTVTFNNYPAALRVENVGAEDAWVNIGADAEADAADNYFLAAGATKVLRCPKQRTVVLSFINADAAETPTIYVERQTQSDFEYVS